jgi:hypothetical protein
MGSETVGRKVTLDLVRGGTRDRVDVTIGERPGRRERTHAGHG